MSDKLNVGWLSLETNESRKLRRYTMALLRSQDFDDMFYRYTRPVNLPRSGGHKAVTKGDWTPKADITDTDKEFVIKTEIPDVAREDVNVTIDNGVLIIQGERKQENEDNGKRSHRLGYFNGSFTSRFTLPDNADETKVKASFKDGLLNLRIKKTKVVKPKVIVVKVE
jgi:HSP20 family protein